MSGVLSVFRTEIRRIFTVKLGTIEKHAEIHAMRGVRHLKTAGTYNAITIMKLTGVSLQAARVGIAPQTTCDAATDSRGNPVYLVGHHHRDLAGGEEGLHQ